MKFTKQTTEPCIVSPGRLEEVCDFGVPPTEPNCEDPAYRLIHPEECEGFPVLILKPSLITICTPLGVQFKTYLYANGVETEVSVGVEYQSSDSRVAIIGAISGKASSVGAGIATISVRWQNLVAYAQVTVVSEDICCEDNKVGMLMLVDNSNSMRRDFAFPYARRIDYARILVHDFVGTINAEKDVAGIMTFNESGQLHQEFTSDTALLKSKAASIPITSLGTDLKEALTDAVNYINADATLNTKVIVLVTDGDDHGEESPMTVADDFIANGGVLVVVGVRAFGAGFDLLIRMASGGYFLNAIGSTAADTIEFVTGFRGYFCAGNCVPPGDVVVPKGRLQFDSFDKWNVLGTGVDLIGGTPPYDLYDLLPGNGLYVDLVGSIPPWLGGIETKDAFDLLGDYRLTFKLAGNQRAPGVHKVRVRFGSVLDQEITIDDWTQDFTTYTIDFTAAAPTGGKLSFEQTLGDDSNPSFGILLDDIHVFRDPAGANEEIFFDDFDEENPTYIPPRCGMGVAPIPSGYGSGYGYGYDCFGEGCLTEPPPEQIPDPSPVQDMVEL